MTARTVLLYAVSVSLSCLGSTTWGGVGIWTKGGPGGGPIAVLAVDPAMPATVYAGTPNNGVFKSIDGGAHWVAINTGLTELSITALAIDPAMPATVYLGVQSADNTEGMAPEGTPSRVFKTTDGGAHWTAVAAGLTDASSVTALAIGPGGVVYAGTFLSIRSGGVFKSTDGGAHWGLVLDLYDNAVTSLGIDPAMDTVYVATFYGGVSKSMDAGGTWTAISTGLASELVSALATDPAVPGTVYAGTSPQSSLVSGGVFKSTDGGAHWTPVNSGLTDVSIDALAVDPAMPATVYAGVATSSAAGTSSWAFKSVDRGAHWTPVNVEEPVTTLAIDPA